MASSIMATILSSFNHVGATMARRSILNPRVFSATGASRSTSSCQGVAKEAMKTGEQMKEKTKDVAGKVSETAQGVTEKAKQAVKEAWGSTQETAQNAKDTVMGKADQSMDSIKANAKTVEQSMNTKN